MANGQNIECIVYIVYKGDDDLTRVVTLKMKDKIFKRPITKISPLPIDYIETKKSYSNIVSKKKSNKISVISAFLAIVAISAIPSVRSEPFSISKFENPPGLYFELETYAYMSYANWQTITNIDMRNFIDSLADMRGDFYRLKNVCLTKLTDNIQCKDLLNLLDKRIDDITEKNSMLLGFEQHWILLVILRAIFLVF